MCTNSSNCLNDSLFHYVVTTAGTIFAAFRFVYLMIRQATTFVDEESVKIYRPMNLLRLKLCGSYGEDLSVIAYLTCDDRCPSCGAVRREVGR